MISRAGQSSPAVFLRRYAVGLSIILDSAAIKDTLRTLLFDQAVRAFTAKAASCSRGQLGPRRWLVDSPSSWAWTGLRYCRSRLRRRRSASPGIDPVETAAIRVRRSARVAAPVAGPARTARARAPRSGRKTETRCVLSIVTVLLLTMWGPAILRVKGFYVPELMVPPLAVYLWCRQPRVVRAIFRCMVSPAGIAGALWLTFVAVLGVLSFRSFVGPYSEWRASILLLYGFLLLYTREAEEHQRWSTRLMWVSFAAFSLTRCWQPPDLRPAFSVCRCRTPTRGLFSFGRISVRRSTSSLSPTWLQGGADRSAGSGPASAGAVSRGHRVHSLPRIARSSFRL